MGVFAGSAAAQAHQLATYLARAGCEAVIHQSTYAATACGEHTFCIASLPQPFSAHVPQARK